MSPWHLHAIWLTLRLCVACAAQMQAMAAMQQQAMYANPQQAAMYQVRHRHHSSSRL